jgi:hypothetical protein
LLHAAQAVNAANFGGRHRLPFGLRASAGQAAPFEQRLNGGQPPSMLGMSARKMLPEQRIGMEKRQGPGPGRISKNGRLLRSLIDVAGKRCVR